MSTPTEPRVLITAIKCQRCGAEATAGFTHRHAETGVEVYKRLPMVTTASNARRSAEAGICVKCGGNLLVATEPIPQEDDDGAAQTGGHAGRPAQPQAATDINGGAGTPASAAEGAAGVAVAAPCPDCGQLAMVAVGRCACQVVGVERV